MMMRPTPEPMVNHQAERPAVAASCAVPTVAPPPTHVPAMPPATSGTPAERPPTLKPFVEWTERAARMPKPRTTAIVAQMMTS